MESANIVDMIQRKKLEERMSPPIRNKVFGMEKYGQGVVGKILISFLKIIVEGKELIVKIYEIPSEIKPTVVSVQLGDKTLWKYSEGKKSLDNRTILSQHDGKYFLKTLKEGDIINEMSVLDLVTDL